MNDDQRLLNKIERTQFWALVLQAFLLFLLILMLLRQPTRSEREWLRKHATEEAPR